MTRDRPHASGRSRLAIALIACAHAAVSPGSAWSGTSLQVPVGARGIAMGGAFCAVADDATAPYWNPAGLPWVGHQEVALSHADLFGAGIKDDYASFILPFSRTQAAAVDFHHSGFRDDELDFGESRIDLCYGHRLFDRLSFGGTFKYLSRHTDLDDFSVRNGSGTGFDFGVLFKPIEALRIAGIAQDAFDTRIRYSQGEGTVTVYPRTIRVGAAYSPLPRGTLAVDVDDFLHVGAEYAPIAPLTLRAGLQNDLEGIDERSLSFGLGVRWSAFRFDYALVDHPTLGATSHFGLSTGFNFNPSQVRIERVTAADLYSSLYKTYASDAFGTARVRNLDDQPITARLRVFVPDLMREPSEQEVVLRPGATRDVPLTAVFSDHVMARSGDRPVQVQVTATYQSLRLLRTERLATRCLAYGPGAIDWSQGVAQAAAFVTTRDPVVEAIAQDAVRALTPALASSGNRNLDVTAAIFDATEALGIAYVPDPNNAYATISGTPKAVDTIFYPRETVARRAGDCDDTSVLLAALLGNVGIRTQFVDVPGHIFLLVSTDVHARNRLALGFEDSRYVVADEEVWIPLETTALGKGFAEAWRLGAESYSDWLARGRAQRVDVSGAQLRYEPADLPSAPPPPIDAGRLQARLKEDLDRVAAWRDAYLGGRLAEARDSSSVSPAALNEVARVYYMAGRLEEALAPLARALDRERQSALTLNNLGVVEAARGDLEAASERFLSAGALDGDDPGIWLNLGLARYAAGDSAGAREPLDRGVALCGGYSQACALLGLAPEADAEREGSKRMTADEARALLKAALRNVPARGAGGAPPARSPSATRPWTSRIAGGRSAGRADFADLLYWKR